MHTFQSWDQIYRNLSFWVKIINSKYCIYNLDVRFALSVKFHKNWYTFQFWDQILQIFSFGSRSSIPINILVISMFDLSAKFHKNQAHCNCEIKSAPVFNFASRSAIWNIIFMINELDLLWVSNFIALGIYFIFGNKFSWNEGIDTCFNVECVLFGRNCDFLGGYLVVTALYLVVTAGYCLLPVTAARSHF